MDDIKYNLIIILGPTATGKTRLAAKLAFEFNGEIISADSRQVYKRMDIGTGKDYYDYIVNDRIIPFHLIDIIEPSEEFNLFMFREFFNSAFEDITKRNKLPFLVGGTGLFINSIIKNYALKKADFNKDEIDKLKDLNIKRLEEILHSLKPNLHNITDLGDKDRIIKAIMISKASDSAAQNTYLYPFVIGVRLEREEVKKRITERLNARLKAGMIEEVEELLKSGITFDKLDFFGLEYKFIGKYLNGELSYNDMHQKLNSAIHNFAKRQMTWFRKMEREGIVINWINGADFDQAKNLLLKIRI